MKRLLLDLDGTLTAYNFPALVKQYFGVEIDPSEVFAYDLADVLGVSHEEINQMFRDQVYGKPTFMENALDILNAWRKKNLITLYTNRVNYMSPADLIQWCFDYKIPFDSIDMQGNGSYDIYVDDCPSKLIDVRSDIKLLYNQPWNKRCKNIRNLRRVSNWLQIQDVFNSVCADTITISDVQQGIQVSGSAPIVARNMSFSTPSQT